MTGNVIFFPRDLFSKKKQSRARSLAKIFLFLQFTFLEQVLASYDYPEQSLLIIWKIPVYLLGLGKVKTEK